MENPFLISLTLINLIERCINKGFAGFPLVLDNKQLL